MEAAPDCICIIGPTATGKSQLALELAARFPLEIVSMDSVMVYRSMDIGTAKPTPSVRARVPHHLIDVVDPRESYSAGRFRSDALAAISAVRARGRYPLVVGGTLLYLRALREGLAVLPLADAALRRELDLQGQRLGWPALHAELGRIDPATAARIAPADRQRIQRALEVYRLTGETLTELLARGRRAPELAVRTLALLPGSRARLAERVEARFDAMVASGLLEEVAALRARGDLTAATPAMRAVGYRQLWEHLEGRTSWEEARRRALAATRQLAKRQLTWLKGEAEVERLSSEDASTPGRLAAVLARALEG